MFFRKKNGFTLLEVIVATAIISIGLLALLTLMNFTFANSDISTNRLIAANLAQEGIEVVRSSRDSSNNWGAWFIVFNNGDYRAEIRLTSPYNWSLLKNPSSGYQLRYNQTMGLYHYENNGDPLSIFSRRITIEDISSSEKKITSTVTWTERGRNYSLSIEHKLYNWHW